MPKIDKKNRSKTNPYGLIEKRKSLGRKISSRSRKKNLTMSGNNNEIDELLEKSLLQSDKPQKRLSSSSSSFASAISQLANEELKQLTSAHGKK